MGPLAEMRSERIIADRPLGPLRVSAFRVYTPFFLAELMPLASHLDFADGPPARLRVLGGVAHAPRETEARS